MIPTPTAGLSVVGKLLAIALTPIPAFNAGS